MRQHKNLSNLGAEGIAPVQRLASSTRNRGIEHVLNHVFSILDQSSTLSEIGQDESGIGKAGKRELDRETIELSQTVCTPSVIPFAVRKKKSFVNVCVCDV